MILIYCYNIKGVDIWGDNWIRQKFTIELGDLKILRNVKWFCKNKLMADVISKVLKEEDIVSISHLFGLKH